MRSESYCSWQFCLSVSLSVRQTLYRLNLGKSHGKQTFPKDYKPWVDIHYCVKSLPETWEAWYGQIHADQDTGTILAIPAQHPGLTCSRKRTLFPSTVLAAVITVNFVGGQGWPAMHLVLCQHEAMAAPTCARAGSQLGTDHAPFIWFFCLSTTILAPRATRRLMSDTNRFSATRAGKIMWRFCWNDCVREIWRENKLKTQYA